MDLRAALVAHRLVAIVRGTDPEAAVRTVLTLAEEGVKLIEVSLTGTDALSVIERAREELGPDRPLGAGTVLTADDARAAHRAGELRRHPGTGGRYPRGTSAGTTGDSRSVDAYRDTRRTSPRCRRVEDLPGRGGRMVPPI